MAKKKPLKILVITFFCALFLAGVIFLSLNFINFDTEETQSSPAPNTDRYFVAMSAVFNNEYSSNFNGTYKFKRVNFVYFSNLSADIQDKIYAEYKVSDTMGLLNALTSEKSRYVNSNKETLIINNDIFQINHNKKPYLYGTIYGNDDYSIFYNNKGKQIASVSLSNISVNDLKKTDSEEKIIYHGSEIYITQTKEFMIDDKPYSLDLVYVYDLI